MMGTRMSAFAILLLCAAAISAHAAERIHVIHCTDLYHPHEDLDDHFDLGAMYAVGQIDLKAIILDKGERQQRCPGRIPMRQMNTITGRDVPCYIGLSQNLATPQDKVLEDKPEFQEGVDAILKVLRDSPTPVGIVTLGSCRDIAAAFNRDPDLLRKKIGKLMIFIGEADASKQDYREYNVNLDRNAFIRIMRSGLAVYWVPCFDGGVFKNNGHASYWVARHEDLLARCRLPLIQYFIYAVDRKDASKIDPIQFLSAQPAAAEQKRLMSLNRNLWCAAVFTNLAGMQIVRQDGRWQAVPIDSRTDARPVFGFREVEVHVSDDAAISYRKTDTSRKVMRFEVLDRQNYPAAMTAVTAELLSGLGQPNK